MTLVELLVALLIFAMISSTGVYALRLALDGREQLQSASERLRDWQALRVVLRQDLYQATTRVARDEFGNPARAALLGGRTLATDKYVDGELPLIAFTRRGWANIDAAAPRSTLQYVEYLVRGEALIRRTRSYVDEASGATEIERVLLNDVRGVTMDFMSGETTLGLQWANDWPVVGVEGDLPRAVRLRLTSPRYGEIEILIPVGGMSS
jgi:general secretion pathway protein J